VALTTVRTVLDPQHHFPPEHFVLSDKDSVALNLDALDIDVERFLATTSDGLEVLRRGDVPGALAVFTTAAAAYTGDFLEENPYDDWAVAVREEARAAYVSGLRLMARHTTDADMAITHLLRILETDRYDEEAHLGLVRTLADARRHGEAHRHYLNYRRAMDELEVEPSPFPGTSRVERADGGRAPGAFSKP
jgi:DNA-binding SARP family transcriptional activator